MSRNKIHEATMSQLRTKLFPGPSNAEIKSVKQKSDNELEMDKIQNDPKLALGYDTLKDPKTGILPVRKDPPEGAWGSYNPDTKSIAMSRKDLNPVIGKITNSGIKNADVRGRVAREPDNPIPKERYKATTTHEIGHAASERLNPANVKDGKWQYGDMPLKYGSKRTPIATDSGKIRYHDPGTEELRQRRADLTYRTGKPREDSLKWTTALNDRDQQALDKINDRDRSRSRQVLYKKYGAPDRSTMSDRDLGKAATGTIIPEETRMSIKERFYQKLQESREQLDELKQSTKDRYVERSSKEETLATFGARHSSGKAKEKFQNVARKRRKGLSLALKRKED